MTKTIYLNLEDDVAKIASKIKRESAAEVVLVFPKQSFIFSDSINLRLLKKQIDLFNKKAFILTMDKKGQMYAQEAGFELRFLPNTRGRGKSFSDIRQNEVGAPKVIAKAKPSVPLAVVPTDNRTKLRKLVKRPVRAAAATAGPLVSHKNGKGEAQALGRENVFFPPQQEAMQAPRRRSYRKYIIGFIAVSMIVALLLVLVVLPSASIAVYAKPQTIARDIDIIADASAQAPDATRLTIPAVAINETQSVNSTFQTLGKKEVGSKAQGRVAIMNLTGSPINLRAGTTTLTVGSKSYVFTADQSGIKAVADANSESSATVADIVATEGGEASNLPAGTRMEITNQTFGNQPSRLFAKTVTQVIGGSSRFISIITAEDLKLAQDELTKQVIVGINTKLQADNRKLIDGSFSVSVSSFTSDKPVDTESPTFIAQSQIVITGLGINEQELKQMVRQRLLLSLGTGKTLQDIGKDQVIYKIKNIDTSSGVMQLSLHYESAAVPAIDINNLKNQIAGKTKIEASELILANPDVDKAEITVQPGWQTSLPRFSSKIKLEIRTE